MTRNRQLQVLRMVAVVAFTAGASGMSAAHGGGGGGGFSGGDSGDSSMNPFTGDSYAYFHGGHNLGEQGTIRPNRPNPRFSTAQTPNPGTAQNPNVNAPATASTADRQSQNSNAARNDMTQQSRRAAPSD
jgi:hypothetical protein